MSEVDAGLAARDGHPSIIRIDRGRATCVVRLKETVVMDGRLMCKHGQHGALVELPLQHALRLVEVGRAKLPAGVRRSALREACGVPRRTGEGP